MGKITVLDQHMVNMIAAGEVIERPASVVKELLENSIDAGAKNITLELEEGGKKIIRIIDDGVGMDTDDLSKAFVPHATSKIKNADDLLKISTMGFRGEALASIGSVAKVTITSRTADSIEANIVEIDCGENQVIKPASGSYGTTIEVANLFYKLPARRKFLKTANTEMTHIAEQFTRIALANPNISFTLVHNGRKNQALRAGETLLERIDKLFANLADDLISVSLQDKGIRISGFIGKPSAARANSKYQYLFLNGRYVRDKFLGHAIKESYRGMIEQGRFGVVFLFLQMPLDSFDVNVHPSKIEVRFDNPNLLHSQVLSVMRDKLVRTDVNASADFSNVSAARSDFEPGQIHSSLDKENVKEAISDFFEKHKKTQQGQLNFVPQSGSRSSSSSPSEYKLGRSGNFESFRENFYSSDFAAKDTKLIQIHNSYIIAENPDGFEIIDQHALHERILYEKMLNKIEAGQMESQKLLVPANIDVDASGRQAVDRNKDLFKKLGLEIEEFGPNTIAVHSFPVVISKLDPVQFVQDLIDLLVGSGAAVEVEALVHEVLDMAACKAAIKAGQRLTDQEMFELLEARHAAERSSNCPHGRPTTIKFSISQLEKQFKRS